ncbi:hypothetical protein LUZ63_004438 [Rhynchospora breviuscula]|uniref:Uncharacterized protein n=1 Tax=Rhynchospora breviuscula TaxID=2022672 RepID=A0A9Q0D515_9POAL|nr:hypothetical protein LUZ63_004438 [Rhynchospora breviuscula]
MNNHTDNPDITVIEEALKQVVHEETEEKTIKATENKEQTRPKLSLEYSLKQRIDKLPEKGDKMVPLAISRIPANVRRQNRIFYEPEVVSIGPFYRGRESLRAMEEQKIYLLRDFLARYPETDIKVLVKEMRQLEDRARQCYAESIGLDSREFVKMLLLDGCFILENSMKWLNNEPDRLKHVRWATEGDAKQINEEPVYVFPCATELLQSGIILKPKKSSTDLLDITFQDGVLEMPPLYLDPHTKVTFLNIVAFEQSNGENEFLPFSSYVALMENLVKRSKDVVALRRCGIIYTFDPSEKEAARFFNHAGHVVVLDPSNHYFANLFREIKFCYDTLQRKFKK